MDTERARRALEETARRQGLTLEEVVSEIEEAIETAILQAKREKNDRILSQ
jgi:predicted RNase H-like HicB family nuclease